MNSLRFILLFAFLTSPPLRANVLTLSGDIQQLTTLPSSVAFNQSELDGAIQFFPEHQNLRLETNLDVDHLVSGAVVITSNNDPSNDGVIAAGRMVNSHYFHADLTTQAGSTAQILQATVTFDTDILGLIFKTSTTPTGSDNLFEASDDLFAVNNMTFQPEASTRGERRRTADGEIDDRISVDASRRTLTLTMRVLGSSAQNCDDLRVITAGTPPDQGTIPSNSLPNIVIFLADDMGSGDTSAYQDWTGNTDAAQVWTPNLDRLARMGLRFTDAHTPSSVCSPTRYSLLTGRYCWRTRLTQGVLLGPQKDPLIEIDRPTIATLLRDAGYNTGMVGKWHVGLKYRQSDGSPAVGWNDADLTQPILDGPIDHGFNFFYGFSRSHPTSGPNGQNNNGPDQTVGPGWIEGRTVIGATGNGRELDGTFVRNTVGRTNFFQARRFLLDHLSDPLKQSSPFFLYYASHANHTPHTPSADVNGVPVAGQGRFVDGTDGDDREDFIYENDVALGELISFLAHTDDPRHPEAALIKNTLLIFTSDNGAERNSNSATGPLRSNKGSVYEGGHRVPFIATWPAGGVGDGKEHSQGATTGALLGLNDMFATLAELVGAELPDPAQDQPGGEDSFSRLPVLRQQPAPPRPPLILHNHKQGGSGSLRAWIAIRHDRLLLDDTAVPGEWKLLINHRLVHEGITEPQELYRLDVDLAETNDLIADPTLQDLVDHLATRAARFADQGYSREPIIPSPLTLIASPPDQIRLVWPTSPFVYYQLLGSTNLRDWQPTAAWRLGDGTELSLETKPTETRFYWKLRMEP